MASRPFAAARRAVRHLRGRHSLRVSIGGAVSGVWLWRVDCCREVWRRCGTADTRQAALDAARAVAGEHDEVVAERHLFGTKSLLAWPSQPSLWVQATQITLPADLRGLGRVVAADASRRDSDRHAGWGVVTDAGWIQKGRAHFNTSNVTGLELLAIGRALQLYPAGHQVDVLSDNLDAINTARRIFAGKLTDWSDTAAWIPHEAFTALHKAAGRHLRVRVIDVKSKTHPLHNIADRLARGLEFGDLITPREDS